ncbi:MAG: KpsF/GutQ family sugar-phosphate isomerase [Elusimicrobia bacterium]|nr:KpsF/GutQ family sugar-phosphate isomerase [Elusimicrobiota bacterium]
MNIIKEVLKVIEIEKKTIEDLSRHIGKEYKKTVEMIFKCKGKVIVTGIGKSGLIAQKIASTFVSTGTLAVYMHTADAMHGDLGIVEKKDIVIAIGKSGESNELLAILPVIKKIGAKVISITANSSSTLSKYSDVILYTKIEKEACPLDLAPTCSTTAALVVGDALAVALMKMRHFKKKDFALYHPGGKLGKRLLLTVGDIMRSGERNPVIKINDTVKNMLFTITEKMSGAVSVVDKNGKLKGLVADYDIRKTIERGENLFKKKISEIMKPDPLYIFPNIKASKALEIMENRDKPISLLPVVDKNKKVIGMLHIHDILAKGLQ